VQAGDRVSYRLTFAVLAAGGAAFALLQSLIIPVLPTVQANLHTTQNAATWILTAYLLSASICTPIVGRIGDMTGKKRMLVITLVALALGSVLAALADSIGVMIAARVIQGIGGGVLPLSFGIVRDVFPEDKVSGTVSIIASLTGAGSGLGIAIAGPIVSVLSYQWLFWLPAIMVTIAAIAAYFVVPESPVSGHGKINWLAAVLLAGWLASLLLAVSEAPEWGWASFDVLGLLALAVLLGVAWIWIEARSSNPLIDMKMMRIPAVWTVNTVALLVGAGMYATFAFAPQFIQTPSETGYGFSASITISGVLLLPQAASSFILGSVSGRLTDTFGGRRVLASAMIIATLGFAMLTGLHDSAWQVVVALTVIGVGFGTAYAAMSNLVVNAVPKDQTGVASGMNANIRTIGGSIGTAAVSSMVTANVAASGLPTESGYTNGFMLMTIITAVAIVAAMAIPATTARRRRGRYTPSTVPHGELGLVAGGTLAGSDPE